MNKIVAVKIARLNNDEILVTGYSARQKNRKEEFQFKALWSDRPALYARLAELGLRDKTKASS